MVRKLFCLLFFAALVVVSSTGCKPQTKAKLVIETPVNFPIQQVAGEYDTLITGQKAQSTVKLIIESPVEMSDLPLRPSMELTPTAAPTKVEEKKVEETKTISST